MNVEHIREFLALAETLNFSKTAERLYIAQSTLSNHIAALERSLGVRLLNRSTTHVELTEQGKIAQVYLTEAMKQIENMQREISETLPESLNSLVLAVPAYWMADYAEPILEVFSKKHPDAQVSFLPTDHLGSFDLVLNKKADVCIGPRSWYQASPSMEYREFAKEPFIVIMGKDNALARKEEVEVCDLSNETLIFVTDRYGNKLGNDMILDVLERNGLTPHSIERTQNTMTLESDIKLHNGVGVFPQCLRFTLRPYNTYRPLIGRDCTLPLSLCYRKDNGNLLVEDLCKAAEEAFPSADS